MYPLTCAFAVVLSVLGAAADLSATIRSLKPGPASLTAAFIQALSRDCISWEISAETKVEYAPDIVNQLCFSADVKMGRDEIDVQLFFGTELIWTYECDGLVCEENAPGEREPLRYAAPPPLQRGVLLELPFDGCEVGEFLDTWLDDDSKESRLPAILHSQASSPHARLIGRSTVRIVKTLYLPPEHGTDEVVGELMVSVRELEFCPETKLITSWIDCIERFWRNSELLVRVQRERLFCQWTNGS